MAAIQSQRQSELLSSYKSYASTSPYTPIATENFQCREVQSQLDRLAFPQSVRFPFLYAFPYSHIYSLHESKVPEFEATPPWHLVCPESFLERPSARPIRREKLEFASFKTPASADISRQVVSSNSGTTVQWNLDVENHLKFPSYRNPQSLFSPSNPPVLEFIHPSSLYRWVKLQSLEFVSRTFVELLDLRAPFKEVRYLLYLSVLCFMGIAATRVYVRCLLLTLLFFFRPSMLWNS